MGVVEPLPGVAAQRPVEKLGELVTEVGIEPASMVTSHSTIVGSVLPSCQTGMKPVAIW